MYVSISNLFRKKISSFYTEIHFLGGISASDLKKVKLEKTHPNMVHVSVEVGSHYQKQCDNNLSDKKLYESLPHRGVRVHRILNSAL